MKVLAAVVLAPHWEVAGGANAALRLSTALANICDIDLARMAASDAVERHDGLTVYDRRCANPFSAVRGVMPQSLFTLFYRADIPELIQTKAYDLVHIHNPLPALEMQRIARTCLQAGIPYVVSTHGLVEFSSKGLAWDLGRLQRIAWAVLVDRPFRYVMRNAASVLALSPADLPILADLGCRADRTVIVPNGVHLPPARSDPAAIERLCVKLGMPFPKPRGVPVCMFLANHTKNKGVGVLLDAFGGYDGPIRLIIAGSKRDYIDYAKYTEPSRFGPHQSFHFPGFVTDDEVGMLMDYADLFVFPTLSDTAPLVILEAMAHGLPVLATRVGGIPYQVPESYGCLVEPGNPTALLDGFKRLTKDMTHLAAMGRAAQAHVAQHCSWDASAHAARSVYRALVPASVLASRAAAH